MARVPFLFGGILTVSRLTVRVPIRFGGILTPPPPSAKTWLKKTKTAFFSENPTPSISHGGDPNGRAGSVSARRRKPGDSKEDRWRSFSIAEVKERDFKLDGFKWLKEESLEDTDDLPEPEELATDAISELEGAVDELNEVLKLLEISNG